MASGVKLDKVQITRHRQQPSWNSGRPVLWRISRGLNPVPQRPL